MESPEKNYLLCDLMCLTRLHVAHSCPTRPVACFNENDISFSIRYSSRTFNEFAFCLFAFHFALRRCQSNE